jgi:dTDP-4-amino-4,6-dideoxygalactose transaminase
MFPVAESILKQTCCLPIFSQMADEEVDYVIESLKAALPICQTNPVI